MVAIEQLDDEGLQDLVGHTDDLGILSVYMDANPTQDPRLQAAAIDLRNRYRELQREVARGSVGNNGREVATRLEQLWPQVADLADPTLTGRGRIAFFALGHDWTLQFESAMPLPNRLVLEPGPLVHPLLEVLDEGRPAGVVIVSAEGARMLEWRLGSMQELSTIELEYVEAPHERAGQIGGGPRGQYNTPAREQRQARDREQMSRFLDRVARATAELAGERRWERIVVSAGERWTDEAVSRLPLPLRNKVFGERRVLNGLDDAALALTVSDLAHQRHAEYERRLVERVREAGHSGAAGALGVSEVVAAMNAGRVAHLVYDPHVRYVGSIGADGLLYAEGETGPDGEPGTPEPRLTERLVERALETSARVSPVEGAADEGLRESGGVGALLRW